MAALIQSLMVLSLVVVGLVYIVHQPTAVTIAKRAGKAVLVVIAADLAITVLWTRWTGRLLLAAGIAAFLMRRRP